MRRVRRRRAARDADAAEERLQVRRPELVDLAADGVVLIGTSAEPGCDVDRDLAVHAARRDRRAAGDHPRLFAARTVRAGRAPESAQTGVRTRPDGARAGAGGSPARAERIDDAEEERARRLAADEARGSACRRSCRPTRRGVAARRRRPPTRRGSRTTCPSSRRPGRAARVAPSSRRPGAGSRAACPARGSSLPRERRRREGRGAGRVPAPGRGRRRRRRASRRGARARRGGSRRRRAPARGRRTRGCEGRRCARAESKP